MNKTNLLNLIQSRGSILPVTLLVSIMGLSVVYGYFNWIGAKKTQLRYRIAKTKAFYNAETGMAEEAYPYLNKNNFVSGALLNGKKIDKNMGSYQPPQVSYDNSGFRVGKVIGVSNFRDSKGNLVEVYDSTFMKVQEQSMGIYMYLTDSELAGGAPFVFDYPGSRREVSFGSQDQLNGIVQSNGQIVLSQYGGCPDFSKASIYLTNGTGVQLSSSCNSYSQLFGGYSNIDTASQPPVNLPPTGYQTLKENANYIYDATEKIYTNQPNDSLIMTRLEFFETGSFNVKMWWYLKPPHLKANPSNVYLPTATDIEGVINSDLQCYDPMNPLSCTPYIDSLFNYHAKIYNPETQQESYVNNTINGTHGFHHFDFEPIDNDGNIDSENLILNETRSYTSPSVIYIKGGPVQVLGKYKGRYTIVTDEYTTYRRHVSTSFMNPVIDTLWNNIWIIDDLVNADADDNGSLEEFQPSTDCSFMRTNNIMGLVSGANVIIANTQKNGARNSAWYNDILINAGIIALNESFVMHYWQNTVSGATIAYSNPPYADGRGISRFGGGSGNQDARGIVTLWGGIVQKYRGYLKRNQPGPYMTGDIGMDKDYNYDANLGCWPPPFYPAIEFNNEYDEIDVKIVDYGRSSDN